MLRHITNNRSAAVHTQRITGVRIQTQDASKGRQVPIMQITDLKIRKMMADGRLRAIVSITLDQMLAVHDIKVVQGENRLFVAMPSRKDESGIFRDIVHPISAQARQYLEQQILDAYEAQLQQQLRDAQEAQLTQFKADLAENGIAPEEPIL